MFSNEIKEILNTPFLKLALKNTHNSRMLMAHSYNPTYLGG
jgi:hypothetical protein